MIKIRKGSIADHVISINKKLNTETGGMILCIALGLMLAAVFAWGMNGIHPFFE